MDLVNLISREPRAFEQLKAMGLKGDQIVGIAGEFNRQLRTREGPELTDCLTRLDVQGFLSLIDVEQAARAAGIEMPLAERATRMIALCIETLDGDLSSARSRPVPSRYADR